MQSEPPPQDCLRQGKKAQAPPAPQSAKLGGSQRRERILGGGGARMCPHLETLGGERSVCTGPQGQKALSGGRIWCVGGEFRLGGGVALCVPPQSVQSQHRGGGQRARGLCKVNPRSPGAPQGLGGGKIWEGGVSSTCLAPASWSPSAFWGGGGPGGRGRGGGGGAAPAGSSRRGTWASPGSSESAGRSRTGGWRGCWGGDGGGGGAQRGGSPPPRASSHPSAARFPTAGSASPPSGPWLRTWPACWPDGRNRTSTAAG